jgi:uncharacterized membrane protein (DUF106 family)
MITGNIIVGWINISPVVSMIILSGLVTLISTLVTKWMTNQEHLKSLKDRQKQIQIDMKKCKPGEKLFDELQSEMLQISMIMMKSSFKPVLITFIPFILLFNWIKNIYTPLLPRWIWYYLISSIVFSIIYRKVFKMA